MGAKRYSLLMLAYYSSLREAASSAAAPASWADPMTFDSARWHVTVTSQHKDLPLCHGTSVRPSGLFPSVRNNPVGSFVTGVQAEAKRRATKSLRVMPCRPARGSSANKTVKPTSVHWCGMHRSRPNLNLTATLTALLSNFNSHEAMGSANSHYNNNYYYYYYYN